MSRLDLVIFGATGFTGKKVVEEQVRISTQHPELTWGMAGRSRDKLDTTLKEVSDRTGVNLSNIPKIVADVSNEGSLKAMCSGARVVVNCCGPYRLYGAPVVKAAVDCKSHYVDVSGEPQFMEKMQTIYNERAKEAGVYIISACGFDSVPNDLGVVFLQQQFDGILNTVESYITVELPAGYDEEISKRGVINFGTYESLVLGAAYRSEIPPIRKGLFPDELPKFEPVLKTRLLHKKNGVYSMLFPGADAAVVYRTQRYLYETEQKRPVQFKPYIQFPSLCAMLKTIIGLMTVAILSSLACTRKWLLKYPRFFSFGLVTTEGPTENVINNTKFHLDLYGEGWAKGTDINTPPNKKMVARVTGSNPGYGATPTALLFCAITILEEYNKMPSTGGVMTPGSAFSKTNLIKKLNEHKLTYEIIGDK